MPIKIRVRKLRATRIRLTIPSQGGGGSTAPDPDILWWKFNDGSGTAIDATVGPDGTTDASWVAGKSGSGFALEFDGSTDNASSNSQIAWGTNIMTICAWMYFDTVSGTQILLEDSPNYNNNQEAFAVFLDSNLLNVSMRDVNSLQYRSETCAPPSTGQWVHIAIIFDRTVATGDIRVFYDGVEQSMTITENSHNNTFDFLTETLYVGARNNSSLFFDGRIDDLRVYGSALTQDEINAVRDNPDTASSFTQRQTQGNDTDQNHVGDSTTLHLGSSFTAAASYSVSKATVRLQKTGAPSFTMVARIYSDTGGSGPGTQIGADSVETLSATTVTASYANYDFTWSSPIALTNGTRYWLVMFVSANGDNSNYCQWAGNPSGTESQYAYQGVSWVQVQAGMDGTATLFSSP